MFTAPNHILKFHIDDNWIPNSYLLWWESQAAEIDLEDLAVAAA